MKFGIIVPHYKDDEKLAKCRSALAKQTEKSFELRIHDNSVENIGFTAAINRGLLGFYALGAEYVVALNQDCYLKADALEKIADFMDANPKCAVAGIKQIHQQNPDFIIHGGCTQAFPAGRHITGSIKNGDCATNKQMPWVNGACYIIRTRLLPEIGALDENFFLVGSDSDYCYTARLRGYEVWYIADAECIHEHGVTKGDKEIDPKLTSHIKKDTSYFYDKWIGGECFRELALEVFD